MKLLKKENKKKGVIIADMEHLQKLFIMPDSPDKFLEFGNELLDLIHNFFKEKGGIHSAISVNDLAELFSDIDIPQEPNLLKDVLSEVKNKIVAHSVKVGSPYYIGHMTSAIPYFMILIEMIIAALNQNQVKIETAKASTFVERELLAWMHRLVFHRSNQFYKNNIQEKDVALGNITVDGTMANLTAMIVARKKEFRTDGIFPGIRRAGIAEAYRHYGYSRSVIIVSKRGHYSIDKVARTLGIGDDNVIKIPVDSKNKIDINKLERTCNDILDHNQKGVDRIKIFAIIGIAGTTETGNIDNLKEIRRIADNCEAHFHVDAAWGGSVLLVDEYRYLFNGIEFADSVSIDAHKLLYSPPSMGMVLFRDENDLNYLKHYSNYIIRPDSVDLGRFTIEGSRAFTALKPWATLKIFGIMGFKLLFDHAFEITAALRGIVERHCNFEAMNQPELFIFNYRFVPKVIQERIYTLMLKIQDSENKKVDASKIKTDSLEKIERINNLLNELNIELHKETREVDDNFVSRTMYDSPQYFYQNVVVLRTILINPLTNVDVLKEIVDSHNRIGQKIYKADFAGRLEKI